MITPRRVVPLLRLVSTSSVLRVKLTRGHWAWEVSGRAASVNQIVLLEAAVERELITVPQPSGSTVRVLVLLTPKGVMTIRGR